MSTDNRLNGPPYLYSGTNRDRGGLITRQSLKECPEPGLVAVYGGLVDSSPLPDPAGACLKEGVPFRKRL